MYNKIMTNPEQFADNSYAKISENTIEIFGQKFPLKLPFYFPSGKLKSFAIEPTTIKYNNHGIPIGMNIFLYEDNKFHGAGVYGKCRYEYKDQTFQIGGGIFFYPNGNLERFTVNDKIETNFIVDGQKLVLHKFDTVFFYKDTGLPKEISMWYPIGYFMRLNDISEDYNLLEISETGKITAKIYEERPNYDWP
jgi:hypothetical protein